MGGLLLLLWNIYLGKGAWNQSLGFKQHEHYQYATLKIGPKNALKETRTKPCKIHVNLILVHVTASYLLNIKQDTKCRF